MRAVAFIAVRNGEAYLECCVRHLACNGVSVVVIDNESTDHTRDAIVLLQREGLIEFSRTLPFRGRFELRAQLELKQELVRDCNADWVLHLDVDELPQSGRPGERLADALQRAQDAGCNAANFDEFVFLPLERGFESATGGFFGLQNYYFFHPSSQRLVRAWRPGLAVSNVASGGHQLEGDGIRIWPEDLVLRHYPFLSQRHAYDKYAQRRFDPTEVEHGWHRNRIGMSTRNMEFPAAEDLDRLADPQTSAFCRDRPRSRHYWHWRSNVAQEKAHDPGRR